MDTGAKGSRAVASFRASIRPFVVIGVILGTLIGVLIPVAIKQPEGWSCVIAGVIGLLAVFATFLYIRLEVREDGILYRTTSGNTFLRFEDLQGALLKGVTMNGIPQPTAELSLVTIDGKELVMKLRTLPIAAAATIFQALEERGMPVHVPDLWGPNRMATQIRTVQTRLFGEKKPS
jgi:hypothetical protein